MFMSILNEPGRCGKCWGYLKPKDNYCGKCGTKRGDGTFNPEDNIMQVIYGPPPEKFNFSCRSCGLKWSETLMINQNKFCPKCGNETLDVR